MTAASLETVTQVLLELDGYPHLSCQMMANGLPHALVGGAGRHECQGQFLDLVRDALRGAERAALEQQAEHGRRVGEEHAAVEAKQAALKEATASAEAATRVATEKDPRSSWSSRGTRCRGKSASISRRSAAPPASRSPSPTASRREREDHIRARLPLEDARRGRLAERRGREGRSG
ncbi:unnamed protein product [Prorocentrum cordatum]|uniref:Uncharacterized protein n=1 Tax=Prorocentrum cordatum TaxID=2364126 RepID=A0ABN9RH02_9DINO|nr:unnamed protein product [Polarella glacialis]